MDAQTILTAYKNEKSRHLLNLFHINYLFDSLNYWGCYFSNILLFTLFNFLKMTAEEILNKISPNRPWQKGQNTDKMIIKCMHEYAATFNSEWIDVKTELPEVGKVVLIIEIANGEPFYMLAFLEPEKIFYAAGMRQIREVTHWMYLPEKPTI